MNTHQPIPPRLRVWPRAFDQHSHLTNIAARWVTSRGWVTVSFRAEHHVSATCSLTSLEARALALRLDEIAALRRMNTRGCCGAVFTRRRGYWSPGQPELRIFAERIPSDFCFAVRQGQPFPVLIFSEGNWYLGADLSHLLLDAMRYDLSRAILNAEGQ